MLLHWGKEHLEELLPANLRARIKEIRVNPAHEMLQPIPHIDGRNGEVLFEVHTPSINRVSRKKLRKFFTEGQDLNIEVCAACRTLFRCSCS